jgi:cytochrome c5
MFTFSAVCSHGTARVPWTMAKEGRSIFARTIPRCHADGVRCAPTVVPDGQGMGEFMKQDGTSRLMLRDPVARAPVMRSNRMTRGSTLSDDEVLAPEPPWGIYCARETHPEPGFGTRR